MKLYASTLNSKIHRTKYHLCVSMIAELPYIHRLKSVVLRQRWIKKKKSLIGRGKIMGQDVVLLKPQTFVNLIGESVLYIASFLRINVRDIVCIVEDSTLILVEMRVDYRISNLAHEGLISMGKALKSERFTKIRVGIGTNPPEIPLDKYLTQDFTDDENLTLIDVLNKTEEVVRMLMNSSIEEVQEKYNPEGAPKVKRRSIKAVYIDHHHNTKV